MEKLTDEGFQNAIKVIFAIFAIFATKNCNCNSYSPLKSFAIFVVKFFLKIAFFLYLFFLRIFCLLKYALIFDAFSNIREGNTSKWAIRLIKKKILALIASRQTFHC